MKPADISGRCGISAIECVGPLTEALVAPPAGHQRSVVKKRNGQDDVADVSWRQRKSDLSAGIIRRSMNFARSSASRMDDRLFKLPF
jgi:hypothetical protein